MLVIMTFPLSKQHTNVSSWLFMVSLLAISAMYPTQAWTLLGSRFYHHTSTLSSSLPGAAATQRVGHDNVIWLSSTTVRVGTTMLQMSTEEPTPPPSTFREAEIIGLRFMQEGNFDQALQVFEAALKLPGSRPDIIRTKVYQTSPVGGGMGGLESQSIMGLDEFELQAVHYNMACAHAQLKNLPQALANLQVALENGFDNFGTVRTDADLKPLQDLPEFETLLRKYEPKGLFFGGSSSSSTTNIKKQQSSKPESSGGFNPFGLFGSK